MPQRLVIFVEGKGDVDAVPPLVERVVNAVEGYDAFFVDHEPFRVRSLASLVKNNCFAWHRLLKAAGHRGNVGAILLVLDGDVDRVPATWGRYAERFRTEAFCAKNVAISLGEEARTVRAGDAFSLASVFAMKEFEAWLLAGLESLRGKPLADGRGTVPLSATCPAIDPEVPRDAKGLLQSVVPNYDQSLDQAVLAREIDLDTVRNRCRSFRRFYSAVAELINARRDGRHVVTPAPIF